MLLPAYWLSVFHSFKVEASSIAEFQNITVLDSRSENFENELIEAQLNNKDLVIGLSLCGDNVEKLEFLKRLDNMFIYADEVDYGTSSFKSGNKLNKIIEFSKSDINILASGTNINKAIAMYGTPDGIVKTSYEEMLLAKKRGDTSVNYIPNVSYFQLDLDSKMRDKIGEFPSELNPTHTKVFSHPKRYSGYIENLFNALLVPSKELSFPTGLNLRDVTNMANNSSLDKLGLFAFTACKTKKQLKTIEKIIKDSKAGEYFEVITLNGDETTNDKAETDVKARIKSMGSDKIGFIILSMHMGSRSFSVPGIDTVILMYDNGSEHTTNQKTSRAKTGGHGLDGEKKEYANIVSLSFDPNRTNTYEPVVLEETERLVNEEKLSFEKALSEVHGIFNIFKIDGLTTESVKLEFDELRNDVMTKEALRKSHCIVHNMPRLINDSEFLAALSGVTCIETKKKDVILDKGKAAEFEKQVKKTLEKNNKETDINYDEIIEALYAIQESTEILLHLTDDLRTGTFKQRLEHLKGEEAEYYTKTIGISPQIVVSAINNKAITTTLVDFDLSTLSKELFTK